MVEIDFKSVQRAGDLGLHFRLAHLSSLWYRLFAIESSKTKTGH
jgi:hypothetical protein